MNAQALKISVSARVCWVMHDAHRPRAECQLRVQMGQALPSGIGKLALCPGLHDMSECLPELAHIGSHSRPLSQGQCGKALLQVAGQHLRLLQPDREARPITTGIQGGDPVSATVDAGAVEQVQCGVAT